jgi:hypothetical protein
MMTKAQVWCSVVVLGLGLLAPGAMLYPNAPARAQDLPPRPTRQPTAQPSVEPTARPSAQPTARPRRRDDDDDDDEAAPRGLIAGTVIDVASGQPLVSIGVRVGTAIVLSDANGNYMRAGLKPGVYEVTLAPAQGTLVVGPFQVQLARDARVIQHLSVRRPAPRAGGR